MPAATTSAAAATLTITRHVGKCPVCEGNFKLTTDTHMVHHGYQRPGHGSIVGDCFAVGRLPYELSCDATRDYCGGVQAWLDMCRGLLADLLAGKIRTLTERHWNPRIADEQVDAPAWWTPGVSLGDKWDSLDVDVRLAAAKWIRLYKDKVSEVEREIRAHEREVERLTKLVDAWTLQPVRTIEELEVPKAAERAAKKANRDAERAVKLTKKIALYQKRIDTAVAKCDAGLIAEVFESCVNGLYDLGLRDGHAQARSAIGRNHVFEAFGLDLAWGDSGASATLDDMRYGCSDQAGRDRRAAFRSAAFAKIAQVKP